MIKAEAIPVNAGQKGEFYILINSTDGDVLHAPNHWKTQRGAERWAERNGFSVKKKAATKPKAKPAVKPAARKPAAPKKPAVAKKPAARKPATRLPSSIGFIEKNAYGAYVVHGDIGTRRYMGYTKREAIARYNAEAKGKK